MRHRHAANVEGRLVKQFLEHLIMWTHTSQLQRPLIQILIELVSQKELAIASLVILEEDVAGQCCKDRVTTLVVTVVID